MVSASCSEALARTGGGVAGEGRRPDAPGDRLEPAETLGELRPRTAPSASNWRIIQAPMRLVDYVVVHELVHLRHRGHGREYWQALGRVMPDYERRREDLRRCGAGLAW